MIYLSAEKENAGKEQGNMICQMFVLMLAKVNYIVKRDTCYNRDVMMRYKLGGQELTVG